MKLHQSIWQRDTLVRQLDDYHGVMIAVERKLDGVINMMRCYLSFYVVLYRLMRKILQCVSSWNHKLLVDQLSDWRRSNIIGVALSQKRGRQPTSNNFSLLCFAVPRKCLILPALLCLIPFSLRQAFWLNTSLLIELLLPVSTMKYGSKVSDVGAPCT